jgi:hypothetical protein
MDTWLLEFDDETSQFDPKGRWHYGSDCYMRTFRAMIPVSIQPDDEEAIETYLDHHPEAYCD